MDSTAKKQKDDNFYCNDLEQLLKLSKDNNSDSVSVVTLKIDPNTLCIKEELADTEDNTEYFTTETSELLPIKTEDIEIKAEEGDLQNGSDCQMENASHSTISKKKNSTTHQCTICSYTTESKQSFKEHTDIHRDPSDPGFYKCQVCDYRTKQKAALKVHMLTHMDPSEVTWYKCHLCPYASKIKGGLRVHMLTHRSFKEKRKYPGRKRTKRSKALQRNWEKLREEMLQLEDSLQFHDSAGQTHGAETTTIVTPLFIECGSGPSDLIKPDFPKKTEITDIANPLFMECELGPSDLIIKPDFPEKTEITAIVNPLFMECGLGPSDLTIKPDFPKKTKSEAIATPPITECGLGPSDLIIKPDSPEKTEIEAIETPLFTECGLGPSDLIKPVSSEGTKITAIPTPLFVECRSSPSDLKKPVSSKRTEITAIAKPLFVECGSVRSDLTKLVSPESYSGKEKFSTSSKARVPDSYRGSKDKNQPITISGNRVVDLQYVLSWSIDLQYKHSKICGNGKIFLKEENLSESGGLISRLKFGCTMCDMEYTHFTEDVTKKSQINYGFVWGTLITGNTFEQSEELFSGMGIPSMTLHHFNKIEAELEDVSIMEKDNLFKEMDDNGEGETKLAEEETEIS